MEDLVKLLPTIEEVTLLAGEHKDFLYIIKKALLDIQNWNVETKVTRENFDSFYMIEALADKCWEVIHTGSFNVVPITIRKIYTLVCYIQIFQLYFEKDSKAKGEDFAQLLDVAFMLGCSSDIYPHCEQLRKELQKYVDNILTSDHESNLPILKPLKRESIKCEIPQVDCPSLEDFKNNFYKTQPVLLLNTFNHWPALEKWRNLNYLQEVIGHRTVPIELGNDYTSKNWTQNLMRVTDYLQDQFIHKSNKEPIKYLAQHELFEQAPELKSDIRIPDYCFVSGQSDKIQINAYLGPAGTKTPMHTDIKHNLLCQVFGVKTIILAAPSDSEGLYPYQSPFLANTSQVNIMDYDEEKFPLMRDVKLYHLKLQEGDCLYIPSLWWHYVAAETPSFSVSFWFD